MLRAVRLFVLILVKLARRIRNYLRLSYAGLSAWGLLKILWLSEWYSEGVELALIVSAAFDIHFKPSHDAKTSRVFHLICPY